MLRRESNVLRSLLVVSVLLAGCAGPKISPTAKDVDFVDRAKKLQAELDGCDASTSYLCTDRAVCSAMFPRVPDPVTVDFGRVAGFAEFSVQVEPEGYVSEIRRFKKGRYAADKFSITACTSQLALGRL